MNPWYAKAVILLSSVMMVVIRAPHGQRSRRIRVVRTRKGALEIVLLTIAWLAFFLPLIWIVTPVLASADYPLRGVPLRHSFSPTTWRARPTASRWHSSLPSASAPRSG